MDHKKVYENIINKRKEQKIAGYFERHHVIPKSLGGLDSVTNIVCLTAREHFICHYLLTKIYKKETLEWYKMTLAFLMMRCSSPTHKNRYINSRLYAQLKKHHAHIMHIMQSGKNNSQFGKIWISNIDLKENKFILKDSEIPEGWIRGRNKWKCSISIDTYCIICNTILPTSNKKYCDCCRPKPFKDNKTYPQQQNKYSKDVFLKLYEEHLQTKTPLSILAPKYGFTKWAAYDYKRKYII